PFQSCGVGECSGVQGENWLEPVDSNTAERERGHMLSDELLDDDRRVERAAPLDEVVQQSGQDNLRNFQQKIDILGEPGTAAKHECQPADERIADRSGVERL